MFSFSPVTTKCTWVTRTQLENKHFSGDEQMQICSGDEQLRMGEKINVRPAPNYFRLPSREIPRRSAGSGGGSLLAGAWEDLPRGRAPAAETRKRPS